MTTVVTRGAASAQALGYAARATAANYIEDVFSTYVYTGNSSTQTITNGIDLSTKGGLVWIKKRNGTSNHNLYDTLRGAASLISSNSTAAASTATRLSFQATGFELINDASDTNDSAGTYASWTFRKQAKFFDVVTYTGDGVIGRTVPHSLGSTPGVMIIKNTSSANGWVVYHRSVGASQFLQLNTTAEATAGTGGSTAAKYWNSTAPTSTVFTLGDALGTNESGQTYVAYLFAHDAGGFGASGSDNVITCGSFTKSSGVVASISLGYEPQWLLFKRTDSSEPWFMIDNMRGMPVGSADEYLIPNSSSSASSLDFVTPTATGFEATNNFNNGTYIYIAIRRGPMRTPTSGTSVFTPTAGSFAATTNQTIGFPCDAQIMRPRRTSDSGDAANTFIVDRLRGVSTTAAEKDLGLSTNATTAESATGLGLTYNWGSSTFGVTSVADLETSVWWSLRRAPGFFDVVCYTGTGSATTVSHNLAAVPELMIVKGRSGATAWQAYSSALANTEYLVLNTTAAKATGATRWNSTTPTSSVFSLGTASEVNTSAATYVAYLFGTVAGVSKVGSYTGTGTTKQIDCGFTGGARFVIIKRADSTGDWYVWDSARGIVAGNDPYLLLNSTAAEVTNTDYVDTYSAGFEISSTAPAAINANGGTFIFLAIA